MLRGRHRVIFVREPRPQAEAPAFDAKDKLLHLLDQCVTSEAQIGAMRTIELRARLQEINRVARSGRSTTIEGDFQI